MAKAHAMVMRGPVIAESSWRIGDEMARIATDNDDKALMKEALDVHYRLALS